MVYPRKSSENTFFDPRRAAKGHEGPRRKPLQGLGLVCPRRAGEKTFFVREGPRRAAKKTFFVREGPRRAAKKTFVRSWFGLSAKGGGENLFCPRRAAKGREENLCKVLVWSVHESRGEHLFHPRRATKDHEENLGKVIIWSVHEGHEVTRRKPFVVNADHDRLSRESGEKQSDSARRRLTFATF